VILIVGGNARNVGKTTLVCRLIAATPQARWVAVKISGHPHGDDRPRSPVAGKIPATDAFRAAGADEVHLLHETEAERAMLDGLAASGRNVIIESNRAVDWVAHDGYLFIQDPDATDPKPRDRWRLEKASWVLPPRRDPAENLIAWVLRKLPGSAD
jgi:hypothetical protein